MAASGRIQPRLNPVVLGPRLIGRLGLVSLKRWSVPINLPILLGEVDNNWYRHEVSEKSYDSFSALPPVSRVRFRPMGDDLRADKCQGLEARLRAEADSARMDKGICAAT